MEGDDRNNHGFMGSILGRAKKVLFPDMAVESDVSENHQTVISENHTLKTTTEEKEEVKKPRARRRRGVTSSSSSLVSVVSPRFVAGVKKTNADVAELGSVVIGKENRKPVVTNNNNKTKRASSTMIDSLVSSLADASKIEKVDRQSDIIAGTNNPVDRQKKISIGSSSSIGEVTIHRRRNRKSSDGTSSLHFCGDASISSRQLVKSNESMKNNHSTDEVTYSIDDIDAASLVAVGSSNDRFSRDRGGHGSRRNHPHPLMSSLAQVEEYDDLTNPKKMYRSTNKQRGSSSSDQSSVITKRGSSSSSGLSSLMTLPSSKQKTQKSRRDKRDRWKATTMDSHTIAPRLSSGQVVASNNRLNRKSSESLKIQERQDVEMVVCSTPHTIRHRSIQPGEGGDGIMSPPALALSNGGGSGGSGSVSGNPSLKKRFDGKTTPDRISSDDPLIEDDLKSSPAMASPLSLVTKMSTSTYVFEKSSIARNTASSPRVLITSSNAHVSITNNQDNDTTQSDAIIERPVRGSAVLDLEVATVPLTKKKKDESNTSNVLQNAQTKSDVDTDEQSTRSIDRTVGVRPSVLSKVVENDTTTAVVRRSSRQTIPTDRLTITHKKSSKQSKHITAKSSMNQNDNSADVNVSPPKKTVVITTDVIANESAPKGNVALERASDTNKRGNAENFIPHNNANQIQELYNAHDDNAKDEEGWSNIELQTLRNCEKDIDPTSTHCWQEVANKVSSKSAMECQIKWQSLIPTPKVRKAVIKKPIDKNSATVNQTGAASIQDDNNYDEDEDEDDKFNSTPYRAADAMPGHSRNSNMFSSFGASTDCVTQTCLKSLKVVSKGKETPALKVRRKGYNSYIENLRKNINRGEKKTKTKKTMSLIDHRHNLQQQIINANMTIGERKISGKIPSNGTVQIKLPDEKYESEDDMWATNQDGEDEK